MTSPITQAGFTEPQKQRALELRARMQSGETIPLADLIAFIREGEADLSSNRVKLVKTEPVVKKQDVDFF